MKYLALVVSATLVLTACTSKQKTDSLKQAGPQQAEEQRQETQPAIADATPPDPPDSVEVTPDLKHMPTFVTLVVGGLAGEGEKEGLKVDDTFRLFQTDTDSQQVLAFYQKELKDRGWNTDNQVAKSSRTGLSIQEYRHASNDVLFLIIGEPEDPQSSDPVEFKRHVVLLSAKTTIAATQQVRR